MGHERQMELEEQTHQQNCCEDNRPVPRTAEMRSLAGQALIAGVAVIGIVAAGIVFADRRFGVDGPALWAAVILLYVGAIPLLYGTLSLWATVLDAPDRQSDPRAILQMG